MRVIYLHQYFNTPYMSGGTRSYEMARRLVAAGHEVHLITTERSGERVRDGWYATTEAGIQVHWLPVPYGNEMSFRRRLGAFARFAFAAGRKAVSIGGDLVFATSTPLTIALPAVFASRRMKIPMVFEVRDLWPDLPIAIGALRNPIAIAAARKLERFAYRNAAHVVALSPGMKEGVVRAGVSPENVSVIPNSCDIDSFSVPRSAGVALRARYSWLGERPLVVYIGTLGLINGVDYLIRVAERTRSLNPEIRFAIIGSGREEGRIRDDAISCGLLDETVFMLNRVAKREVPAWLSAADLATSLFIDLEQMWANSANKFFDALAAGTPVAINYEGWQAKLLREYGAGLILPTNDPGAAAQRLVEFLSDGARARYAGEAAATLAKQSFDRDLLGAKLIEILQRSAEN